MKLHWLTGLFAVACSIPAWTTLPLTPFEQAPTQPLPHSATISAYLRTLDQESQFAAVTRLGFRPVAAR